VDQWTDRLSEYLDGELEPTDAELAARHVAECPACRRALEELRGVAARARALPHAAPARDLWPGIAARIGRGERRSEASVVRRRLSFTPVQLATAAAALVVLSAAAALAVVDRRSQPGPAPAPIAALGLPAAERFDAAVGRLERALAAGRDVLDSGTVQVIERNLAVIDAAIADARRALDTDPASPYLNHHLAQQMRRKVELLRRANGLVTGRS
jgi:predicted anti-sigma-YlaC factor YlaD